MCPAITGGIRRRPNCEAGMTRSRTPLTACAQSSIAVPFVAATSARTPTFTTAEAKDVQALWRPFVWPHPRASRARNNMVDLPPFSRARTRVVRPRIPTSNGPPTSSRVRRSIRRSRTTRPRLQPHCQRARRRDVSDPVEPSWEPRVRTRGGVGPGCCPDAAIPGGTKRRPMTRESCRACGA